jgi:hypothetical protein
MQGGLLVGPFGASFDAPEHDIQTAAGYLADDRGRLGGRKTVVITVD